MIRRKITKTVEIASIVLAVLLFTMCGKPDIGEIVIPTPPVIADPTPSPTPEIKISEDETQNDLIFLGFDSLLDYVTTSQYNYMMNSTQDFFNSLYQSNIRKYQFTKYKNINSDLLYEKFMFANDTETKVPFNRFAEVYSGDEIEYRFILDEETILVGSSDYKYTVDLYISGEKAASFAFIVSKKTLQIKIQ